ncbi:MAG: hypothetical protein C4576_19280 [Desulfobacteraceae bacterium]|nr:MAG: hypothetical protein C4576_19280 [Desulfobacteraceae bacterium]
MEKAAREQLAGPFGKLGRYALKQHWGITISEGQEPESGPRTDKGGKSGEKRDEENNGLFRRLFAFLKRPFGG